MQLGEVPYYNVARRGKCSSGYTKQKTTWRSARGGYIYRCVFTGRPEPKRGIRSRPAPPPPPPPKITVTVAPQIATQVSPQISPVFQQAFQPTRSPMTAGTQQVAPSTQTQVTPPSPPEPTAAPAVDPIPIPERLQADLPSEAPIVLQPAPSYTPSLPAPGVFQPAYSEQERTITETKSGFLDKNMLPLLLIGGGIIITLALTRNPNRKRT